MDRALVTSTRHPLVQRVRALRLAGRRDAGGLFVAEGVKLVAEALAAGIAPREVLVSPRLERDPAGRDLLARMERDGLALRWLADRVLGAAADTETHQGVLVVAARPAAGIDRLRPPLVVVAAGIQDPGNLGALVRVSEAFGASALLAVGGADPWGPKAVRASAASIFRLPVVEAPEVGDVVEALRQRGFRLVAAASRGGVAPGPESLAAPLALLIGSEGSGLAPRLLGASDIQVTIPLQVPVESLNVVAAAAVLLHAARGASAPAGRSAPPSRA